MALQLGQGGRIRSLNALVGREVSAVNLYVGLYFDRRGDSSYLSVGPTSSLNDIKDWEVASPTTGYTRVQLFGGALDTVVPHTAGLFGEIVNVTNLDFVINTLALPVSSTRQISSVVISTQATANTTSAPSDIIAYGPLMDPITEFVNGDTLRVEPGAFSFRQS